MSAQPYILVAGTGEPDTELAMLAEAVGGAIARAGALLLCGGLGGVMEAAARGAQQAGGRTVGILPGSERDAGNRHLDIALPTGVGEMRNALLVRAADGVVAVGGGYGTLSEVALALKAGKPVVGLRSWELHRAGLRDEGLRPATDPREAVDLVLRLSAERPTTLGKGN